jgi:pimeloyl-ACP methyl ester carboxylesterase
VPVLLVHGNVASSLFFEETLAALPPYYLGLAPDLRGFGRFQPPFRLVREPEEILISEILRTKVGDYNYPGDKSLSSNWPNMAPGRWGS